MKICINYLNELSYREDGQEITRFINHGDIKPYLDKLKGTKAECVFSKDMHQLELIKDTLIGIELYICIICSNEGLEYLNNLDLGSVPIRAFVNHSDFDYELVKNPNIYYINKVNSNIDLLKILNKLNNIHLNTNNESLTIAVENYLCSPDCIAKTLMIYSDRYFTFSINDFNINFDRLFECNTSLETLYIKSSANVLESIMLKIKNIKNIYLEGDDKSEIDITPLLRNPNIKKISIEMNYKYNYADLEDNYHLVDFKNMNEEIKTIITRNQELIINSRFKAQKCIMSNNN